MKFQPPLPPHYFIAQNANGRPAVVALFYLYSMLLFLLHSSSGLSILLLLFLLLLLPICCCERETRIPLSPSVLLFDDPQKSSKPTSRSSKTIGPNRRCSQFELSPYSTYSIFVFSISSPCMQLYARLHGYSPSAVCICIVQICK